MYSFTDSASFEDFLRFAAPRGTFCQIPEWGVIKNTWRHRLIMGFCGDTPVLSALILERRIAPGLILWYSPDGMVCDCGNLSLLSEFSLYMRGIMKKNGVFAYIIDPDIPIRIGGENVNTDIPAILKEAGFAHREIPGDNYTYQPPYTVQLDLSGKTADDILKSCDKGVRYSVKLGRGRGLIHRAFSVADVQGRYSVFDDFLTVMKETAGRVGFYSRGKEYYEKFLSGLKEYSAVDIIYYSKTVDEAIYKKDTELEKSLTGDLNDPAKSKKHKSMLSEIESVRTRISAYKARRETVDKIPGDEIPVAAALTVRIGERATCLFGGTRNLLRNELRASHLLNFVRIEESIAKGMRVHDFGRIASEHLKENSQKHGLYLFKLSFGGKLVEMAGEYALVVSPIKYSFYSRVIPFVKNAKYKLFLKLKGNMNG